MQGLGNVKEQILFVVSITVSAVSGIRVWEVRTSKREKMVSIKVEPIEWKESGEGWNLLGVKGAGGVEAKEELKSDIKRDKS